MGNLNAAALHDLLANILKTHIIAIIEVDGQTTVHVVSKENRVDIAVTMPTWIEALTSAIGVLQEAGNDKETDQSFALRHNGDGQEQQRVMLGKIEDAR